MQYIDNIQPKDEQQGTWQPNHTPTTEWQTHLTYCLQSRHSTDLKYDLASQQRNPLQKNNGHHDVQVYVQIQVTRQFIQNQTTCHIREWLRIAM